MACFNKESVYISSICDKYLPMDRQTHNGKTIYPPPPSPLEQGIIKVSKTGLESSVNMKKINNMIWATTSPKHCLWYKYFVVGKI